MRANQIRDEQSDQGMGQDCGPDRFHALFVQPHFRYRNPSETVFGDATVVPAVLPALSRKRVQPPQKLPSTSDGIALKALTTLSPDHECFHPLQGGRSAEFSRLPRRWHHTRWIPIEEGVDDTAIRTFAGIDVQAPTGRHFGDTCRNHQRRPPKSTSSTAGL